MSYVYHAMSVYFDRDNVALPGMASYFRAASEEERAHAQTLMDFQVCYCCTVGYVLSNIVLGKADDLHTAVKIKLISIVNGKHPCKCTICWLSRHGLHDSSSLRLSVMSGLSMSLQ